MRWLPAAAAFFAIYGIWGSTYLAIAAALEGFPPLLMMGLRGVAAGAVLYAFARVRGAPAPTRAQWGNALFVGVLFFLVGHGLLSWGETRVASGAAAVLIATEPLFIVALGWIGGRWLRRPERTRPAPAVALALALGLGGVAALVLPGSGSLDVPGALALLLASLAWAVGTFHADTFGWSMRAAGMQLLTGSALLLVAALLLGEVAAWQPASVSPRALFALLYLVVFGSIAAFTAYLWLLERMPAERVATHTYVNPVIALVLGAALGGESFGGRTLVASGVILASVLLMVQRHDSRRRRAPRAAVHPRAAVAESACD